MRFHELSPAEQEAALSIVSEQLYLNDGNYSDADDAYDIAAALCGRPLPTEEVPEYDMVSELEKAQELFKRISLRYRKFGDHIMREMYFAVYPDRSDSASISDAPKVVRRTTHVEDWVRWDDMDKQIRYQLALPEHLDVYILIHGSQEAERQQP